MIKLKILKFLHNPFFKPLRTSKQSLYDEVLIFNKEIKINKKYSGIFLKNRILIYLRRLGYLDKDIISEISNYNFITDKSIYLKEKEKITNKYKRKYTGKELEMKVNNYLYNHGFREE